MRRRDPKGGTRTGHGAMQLAEPTPQERASSPIDPNLHRPLAVYLHGVMLAGVDKARQYFRKKRREKKTRPPQNKCASLVTQGCFLPQHNQSPERV